MSGHSKWSKVKHQKAVTDAVKGRAFTRASRAIAVAVKEGGGITDPEKNFRLRLALEQARAVNMPKETIDRAITRAASAAESVEELQYEGYAPGGVALLIEAVTDNRQRTIAVVKNVLEKNGGTIASPGSVAFLFQKSGVVTVPAASAAFSAMEDLAITAGADDVVSAGDMVEFYTQPARTHAVSQAIAAAGFAVDNAQIIMKPVTPVTGGEGERVAHLISALEELEDVQRVYTNLA
jgi:YebC/PmpR family DNA-binding regulatory protein